MLVGGMTLLGGVLQKLRSGRLGSTPFAPTGQVAAQGRSIASAKGAISTQGAVQTQQVLTSPVSGAPCVFYKMKLEVEWTDNGSEQKYTVHEESHSVPFAVNDGSGPAVVNIDAKSPGELCTKKAFERKKFNRGLIASVTQKPLEVTPHYAIPANVQVRGALGRMIDVPVTANFFVTEEYLEPKGSFYVNGKLLPDGAIGAPDWIALLVSDKSHEELVASTAKRSKLFLIGGGVAAPVGAILAIVGHLTAPPTPAPVASLSATATAPAGAAGMVPVPAPGAAAPGAAAPGAAAPGAAAPGGGLITSSLRAEGDCAGLDLAHGLLRVNNGGDGVNALAIAGTTLHRVFVKLGDVAPGATVEVCKVGRRCRVGVQVGVGDALFLNAGRGVDGSVTVRAYDVAAGRMDVTFNAVALPMNHGHGRCVLNGALATSGLAQ